MTKIAQYENNCHSGFVYSLIMYNNGPVDKVARRSFLW